MSVDARASTIGRRQHGLATRRQLLGLGIDDNSIHRRLVAGTWRADGNVVDLRTHRASWHQAVLRAVLAGPSGTVASHATAAHLHGFLDIGRPASIEVTVPRGARNHRSAAIVHSSTIPDAGTSVDGIPVVRWPRAARELAAVVSPATLARVVAALLRTRSRAAHLLVAELESCGPTTAGVGRLRRALDEELGSDRALLESPLEDTWHRALERSGLRPERVQHALRDGDGAVLARFDLAWPSALVAVEVDGLDHHVAARDRRADDRRSERAAALGWVVVRVTATDLGPARRAAVVASLSALVDGRRDRPLPRDT